MEENYHGGAHTLLKKWSQKSHGNSVPSSDALSHHFCRRLSRSIVSSNFYILFQISRIYSICKMHSLCLTAPKLMNDDVQVQKFSRGFGVRDMVKSV